MTDTDSDIYGRIDSDHSIIATDKASKPQLSAPGDFNIDLSQFGQPERFPDPTTAVFSNIADTWMCAYNESDMALIPYTDDYFRSAVSGGIRLSLPRMAISYSGAETITASNIVIITADQIPIQHTRLVDRDREEERPQYELTTALNTAQQELQLTDIEDGSVTHFSQRYARIRDTSSRDSPGPNGMAELYMRCQDLETPPEFPDTQYVGLPINLSEDTTASVWAEEDQSFDAYVATPTEITVVDETALPDELDMP